MDLSKMQLEPTTLAKIQAAGAKMDSAIRTKCQAAGAKMDQAIRAEWQAALEALLALYQAFSETAQAQANTQHRLEILLGDNLFDNTQEGIEDMLGAIGLTIEQMAILGPKETLPRLLSAFVEGKIGAKWLETFHLALGMIFRQRYEWDEVAVKKMTPVQIWLALENALDYTPPNKPDIWEMTK
jgi:hypothetical protein